MSIKYSGTRRTSDVSRVHITLPTPLYAKLVVLLQADVNGLKIYGAMSQLFTMLAIRHLKDLEKRFNREREFEQHLAQQSKEGPTANAPGIAERPDASPSPLQRTPGEGLEPSSRAIPSGLTGTDLDHPRTPTNEHRPSESPLREEESPK